MFPFYDNFFEKFLQQGSRGKEKVSREADCQTEDKLAHRKNAQNFAIKMQIYKNSNTKV